MYISLPSFMLISLDFLFSLIFAFYKRDVCTYNSTNMYKYTRQQQTASFYFSYVVVACYYSRVIIHIEFFFSFFLANLCPVLHFSLYLFMFNSMFSAVTSRMRTSHKHVYCVYELRRKKKSHHIRLLLL